MENEIRRQDRKISENETIEIIKKGEYGILSMSTLKNTGYGIPLNYVLDNDKLYFHCAVEGSKLEYLRANSSVSFCVVGNTEIMPSKFGTIYESAIISGKTFEVNGQEKYDALVKIIEKYSKDYNKEGRVYIDKFYDKAKVIKLMIESISGKARIK